MRDRYASIGVQFAITNSGGLRDATDLPGRPVAGRVLPGPTQPPFPITRGQVLAVLPFGNVVVDGDRQRRRAQGVPRERRFADAGRRTGRFAQVSGLCFTYNVASAAGSRVTGAVLANADGTCSATPVSLTAGDTYKIAINDFMASGGDSYPGQLDGPITRPRTSWIRSWPTT